MNGSFYITLANVALIMIYVATRINFMTAVRSELHSHAQRDR